MRFACWIPKATNTLYEYAILSDFPLQQCLHERSSKLSYTYIAYLVKNKTVCFAIHSSPLPVLYIPLGRVRLLREVGMSCVKGLSYEHCTVTGICFKHANKH